MNLTVQAPDGAAFAPFGSFIEPPEVGGQAMFGSWLTPVPEMSPHYYLNRVAPSTFPFGLDRVECHPDAAQLFLPVGVSRYLVTVMPSGPTGAPDPEGACAFVVPGNVGVAYRPGTWHAGIAVLDEEASFAVLMWRRGEGDDVFANIPRLVLQEDQSVGRSPVHG